MKALTDWLGDCARITLQNLTSSASSDDGYRATSSLHGEVLATNTNLPTPALAHVHCAAAIFWHNNEVSSVSDLEYIIRKDLLRYCGFRFNIGHFPVYFKIH